MAVTWPKGEDESQIVEYPLLQIDFKKLEDELDTLKTVRRKEVAAKISESVFPSPYPPLTLCRP